MDKFVDRVKDGSTSIGIGDFTTSGEPPLGYQSLMAIGPVGTTFPYVIENKGEWEAGYGTIKSIDGLSVTFSRQPTASSNDNALVNFSSGHKIVFLALNASAIEKFVSADVDVSTIADPNTSNMFIEEDGFAKRATVSSVLSAAGVITDPPVQSDWAQVDSTAIDFIKNKPSIPAAQVQVDWDQADSNAIDFIKNKPTIPEQTQQLQSDWNQGDAQALDFIKNKPNIALASITACWVGTIKAQTGVIRNYPRSTITISALTGWLSGAAIADVTAQIRVNGVVKASITIPTGRIQTAATITPFTVGPTDYLTADIVNGAGNDLTLRLDY